MKNNSKKHKDLVFIKYLKSKFFLSIIFLVAIALGYTSTHLFYKNTAVKVKTLISSEIEMIKKSQDIKIQQQLYIKLIKRVGPEKAQDEFQHSGIPYNGQMHLLNHTVGDYIYNKFGPKGITKCKDYFSSSCFHGFIIRGIGNGKLENVDMMMRECKKEGEETLRRCSHALGHGFLAYEGYAHLLEALKLCEDMKGRVPGFFPDFCYNGVFMENIWGLHEGGPSSDR